jgi:hypothetical protein
MGVYLYGHFCYGIYIFSRKEIAAQNFTSRLWDCDDTSNNLHTYFF